MPLDRAHVTAASRIMLPVYVVFFALVGGTYLFTPLGRLQQSPGLAYADALLTLRAWGGLFVAAALLMSAALVAHRREWFRFALMFCGLAMAVWAIVLVLAFLDGGASPTAWVWPGLVVAACVASYRSLTVKES